MRRSRRAALAAVGALTLTWAPAALAQSGNATAGADVFQDRCGACHVLNGVGQGPSLLGVLGRKAASLPAFNYSAAMKASGLVWSEANLDQFLTGPTKLVPGTAMRAIVSNPADRRDLIAYLATLKR
jgi:cytochrome c